MADTPQCPIVAADAAIGTVENVMANMWGLASGAYNIATDALRDLGTINLQPISFNVGFTPDTEWWHVLRPRGPDDPDLVWDPDFSLVPNPPNTDIGGSPAFVVPPTFDEQPPTLLPHDQPGPLTATPPDGPPALDPVVVPDAPVITLPDFPELLTIDLPAVPNITLPSFQGVRPNFNLAAPPNTFGFEPQQYSSALVSQIKSRLQIMINGQPGLPAAAAAQMRDRAYVAVDVQAARAEQEALEDFTSRGWSQPDGMLTHRLLEVRQNNQNQRNSLARDIYLKDVDVAIEDLRFAVAQGIALEGSLMQNFVAFQGQMLDAAKTAMQVAIDVFNAEVALANLELQAYQADAQVFRDLIQAELAKIELYKAQLEGQRLRGELNVQQVTIYSERVRALLSLVEIYKAQVDGAKAKADVNLSRTQAFVAQVSAYSERVKAYETEWEAYGQQLTADLTREKIYETAVEVFSNRVRIWSDTNNNLIEQAKLKISEKDLDVTAYRARLEQVKTVFDAETSRFDSIVRAFAARVEKYRADATVEGIVSDGNSKILQLAIQQESERAQVALKNAEITIAQAEEVAKIVISAREAIGRIGAQLAAGAMSAMHVGANISSSLSQSIGCSTEFKYQLSG